MLGAERGHRTPRRLRRPLRNRETDAGINRLNRTHPSQIEEKCHHQRPGSVTDVLIQIVTDVLRHDTRLHSISNPALACNHAGAEFSNPALGCTRSPHLFTRLFTLDGAMPTPADPTPRSIGLVLNAVRLSATADGADMVADFGGGVVSSSYWDRRGACGARRHGFGSGCHANPLLRWFHVDESSTRTCGFEPSALIKCSCRPVGA